MPSILIAQQTDADFERAWQKGVARDLIAAFARRPNDLLPYHELRRRVSPEGEVDRGVRTVPIAGIVGSTDRYRDFDRAFLPRRRQSGERWRRVDLAYYEDRTLPPIQVYQVGDVYFVKDGNHRVSVARERGQEYIEAEVIEAQVRAPFRSTMTPAQLLLQAEYAEFLRRTDLERVRPDHDIRPSDLGRYDELWEHIEARRRWLEEEFEHRPVGREEAVTRWHDRVYGPIVELARDRGITRRFPGRSEADVYLWLTRRRDELYDRYRRTREPLTSAAEHVDAMRARLGWRARATAVPRRLAWPRADLAALGHRKRRPASTA